MDSCNSSDKERENIDSLQKVQNKTFAVGDYNFAILQGSEFIKYNKAIYQRGDEVYMVLENIGPFARGTDSLNHAEMKLEVTDAIGQVSYHQGKPFLEKEGMATSHTICLKSPMLLILLT
ncbi:MAG: hypothetical protein HC831_02325 [Chloroflexia bacterium]|nr:hypothetical protein [Chloroflexia bacterium]